MSTPNQFPRPSVLSGESNKNVRAAVVSIGSGAATIHRNVSGGVEAAMSAAEPSAAVTEEEMRDLISKKIKSFPPLPQTIVEIYALRRSADPDTNKLLKIVSSDSNMAANMVKISNSVVYGLSGSVKTPADALRRLGTRMVINVAMSSSMSAHLQPDLSPYGIRNEAFSEASSAQGLVI